MSSSNEVKILISAGPVFVTSLEKEYEAYRKAAKYRNRPIAPLIREAMVYYRKERLSQRDRLVEL